MRRVVILVGVLAGFAGCGSSEPPETPVACLAPAEDYVAALAQAPAEVRLDGGTAISACLVDEQESGPLQTVGKSVIDAATRLNEQVRRGSEAQPAIALGYLVGAVQEGASGTGGIHEDLVIRLDTAARYTGPDGKPFGADFERAFGEGYAAGQQSG